MGSPATPKLSEAALQAQVKRLFTLAGFTVYDTSQGYRKDPGGTRMTPGLADLLLFHPKLRRAGAFEVKTPDGLRLHTRGVAGQGRPKDVARAQAQRRFGDLCIATGLAYGIGGMAEAWGLLADLGLAVAEGTSIAGYRLVVSREISHPIFIG